MIRNAVIIKDVEQATTQIIEHVGSDLIIAAPLGLGKPIGLLNQIYATVKASPKQLTLKIYTALSLRVPVPKQAIEKRFLAPFVERHFGKDYQQLDYLTDVLDETLPANVTVHEFYFSSGSQLKNGPAQRHYISQNYTHVARDLVQSGVNVLLQQVAKRDQRYSLASNSDVALDLIDTMDQQSKPFFVVAVVNSEMPFLGGEAEVGAERFDLILDDGQSEPLFGIPREAVGNAEHAIGLHASTLVKDGGTLQIGIGALSDALVNALIMRHQHNPDYLHALKSLGINVGQNSKQLLQEWGGVTPFKKGLYGATEMVMDGFMHLRNAGILSRSVYEDIGLQILLDSEMIAEAFDGDTLNQLIKNKIVPEIIDEKTLGWLKRFGMIDSETTLKGEYLTFTNGKVIGIDLNNNDNFKELSDYLIGRRLQGGRYLEGAFFLGSSELYKWLRKLQGENWKGLKMQRVSQINQFYGGHESLERVQRRDARFFNSCMMHTLMGAAVSDGLEDGQVVSGVGGQYNFVAMAHALDDGRSVIMLRATRNSSAGLQSNICWNYGHTTIPRHLRDMVITEYGIADVRGQCDEEVIKRLLSITDSRFQSSLMQSAKAAGKLKVDFQLPNSWCNNTPEQIESDLAGLRSEGKFLEYPFGSDFDQNEQQLIVALGKLKLATASPIRKILWILRSFLPLETTPKKQACLERMGLKNPQGLSEIILSRLLILFL
jgi:acyl-CoA hydrolase